MDARVLLGRAVAARIEARDHPVIEARQEAARAVRVMLERVVREELPDSVPPYMTLDGVRELSAQIESNKRLHLGGAFYLLGGNDDSMLPVEADLDLSSGAPSAVRVGGVASVFPIPTSERQFARRMANVDWSHRVTLHLG